MTEDELWENLLSWRRNPLKESYCLTVETSESVTEDGLVIVTKKVFNGQLMPPWLKKLSNTPVRIYKTVAKKEQRTMDRNIYLGDECTITGFRDCIRLLDDPLILEMTLFS